MRRDGTAAGVASCGATRRMDGLSQDAAYNLGVGATSGLGVARRCGEYHGWTREEIHGKQIITAVCHIEPSGPGGTAL